MVQGILTFLDGRCDAQPMIALSASLACRLGSRIRALTIADTRRLLSLATGCEGAVFSVAEQEQLEKLESRQAAVHAAFAEACLKARVNFDVRRMSGDPLAVLPREARYHDLVIAGWRQPLPIWQTSGGGATLDPHALVDLVSAGVHPLLIARESSLAHPRILLVNDGTAHSGRTLRAFLRQRLWPDAAFRLLAVAEQEQAARHLLRESTDLLLPTSQGHEHSELETGFACGPLRKVLVPYAEKWGADLIVLGVPRGPGLLRRMMGTAAVDVLRHSSCALYLGE